MSKGGGYFRGKTIKSAQQAPGAAEEWSLSASLGCDGASATAREPGTGEAGKADKVLVGGQLPKALGGICIAHTGIASIALRGTLGQGAVPMHRVHPCLC